MILLSQCLCLAASIRDIVQLHMPRNLAPLDAIFPRRVPLNPPRTDQALQLVGGGDRVPLHIGGDLPVALPNLPLQPQDGGLTLDDFTVAACHGGETVSIDQHRNHLIPALFYGKD